MLWKNYDTSIMTKKAIMILSGQEMSLTKRVTEKFIEQGEVKKTLQNLDKCINRINWI